MTVRYYDRHGSPMTLNEWSRRFGDDDYKVVAKTDIGRARVSTVWLGLDHSISREGPPVIFETLVFGGPLDQEMDRYCTEEEARRGHEEMCERVREGTA